MCDDDDTSISKVIPNKQINRAVEHFIQESGYVRKEARDKMNSMGNGGVSTEVPLPEENVAMATVAVATVVHDNSAVNSDAVLAEDVLTMSELPEKPQQPADYSQWWYHQWYYNQWYYACGMYIHRYLFKYFHG